MNYFEKQTIIETTSDEMLDTLYSETFLKSIGRTKDNAMSIFIP